MKNLNKAWIFGAGGHARVVHSFIRNQYSEISFVLQENEKEFFEKYELIKADHFFVAIGDNLKREAVFLKLKKLGATLPICIGPNSYIDQSAKIGDGVFIGAGVNVLVNAVVGSNVIINTGTSVDHDCSVGDNTQLTAGVRLAGGTQIGSNVFLGMGVITIPGIIIGSNVQIMAGSVVVKHVEKDLILGGYPARIIKKIGE